MKLKRCLMISLLMMLTLNSISAEIIENSDGTFSLTREDLEEIKNAFDELEVYRMLYTEADKTITEIKIDLTKLGTAIDDLKQENKRLKIQRIIFGISGIGIGIGITLLISNFVN